MANPITYKTRIVLRTDTTQNWESKNSPLLVGEMGYAIDNAVVTCCKVGIGLNWKATPILFTPFKPIVTNYGRNLDAEKGGPPYNAQHNFQTEDQAWEYVLYPYAPPSVNFPATIIQDSEIGDTFNMYQTAQYPFDFNIFNTPSIFLENGIKKYYIDSTHAAIAGGTAIGFPLTDQTSPTVLQTHNKSFVATSNSTGNFEVIKVSVRGSKNPSSTASVYDASAYVRFRIRSAAFLYRSNTELLDPLKYTDAQLSAIIRTIGNSGDMTGVRYTNMADGGGNKMFNGGNAILWNTKTLTDIVPAPPAAAGHGGFFNIVIAAPDSAGIPTMFNSASDASNPMLMNTRTFTYTNNGASVPYTLYVSASVITGTLSVKII